MITPSYLLDLDAVLKEASNEIEWRSGLPNYSKVNILFDKHKTTHHLPGSLESTVQNLIKNWEKEVTYKINPTQWKTVDLDNYRFSCNGLRKYTGWEMVKLGTYNALIGETSYYNAEGMSFEESHTTFKRTFSEGFAWEVIEVYSPPPNVTFKWRHFGRMTEYFSCRGLSGLVYKADPTNRMVQIYGMCKATLSPDMKIQDLEVFYDPSQLFIQLTEICPFAPFAQVNSSPSPLSKSVNSNTSQIIDPDRNQRTSSSMCTLL